MKPRKVEEAKRIPNMDHATKYYQDFFAFEDLEPTDAENIDPKGPAGQNAAAIEITVERLLKQLRRLDAVKETMLSPGWLFIEQKALRTIRKMEQEFIWDAIRKADQKEIERITLEHEGIIAFFQLVDPLKDRIALVKSQLDAQIAQRKIYVEGQDPLTVIEKEG